MEWMAFPSASEVVLVNYEALVEETGSELVRLTEFLGVRVDRERFECVLRNKEGSFHRPQAVAKQEFPYTKACKKSCQVWHPAMTNCPVVVSVRMRLRS